MVKNISFLALSSQFMIRAAAHIIPVCPRIEQKIHLFTAQVQQFEDIIADLLIRKKFIVDDENNYLNRVWNKL